MKNQKRRWDIILLSILFIIIFLVLVNIFIPNIVNKEYLYLIPICIFTIIIILNIIVLINYLILIPKSYYIEGDYIIIKKKNKIINKINKLHINKVNIIYDYYDKEILLIYFKYNNKKIYIKVNEDNRNYISLFINNIKQTKKSNALLYIIDAFCQIIK